MTQEQFDQILSEITPANRQAMDDAQRRQAQLAKPPGSLGQLEDMSIRLAGITGQVHNTLDDCCILVFAADNGVIAEGVSSAPESVTMSQAINMTRHLTGMSALAHYFGNRVIVTDVGIRGDVPCPQVVNRKIRRSTGNLYLEPAMTRQQALDAMAVGMDAVESTGAADAIGIGEMGIGNTTTSAAVLSALTGESAERVTGRGGGITDESFRKKKQVIAHALQLHRPDPHDPIDVLSKVGGLDLCAMTGAFLACAHRRIPAVVDGFISIVAALCAYRLCPNVKDFLFLSHESYELGYRLAAQELGLRAYLLLDMRLGEGSGCPLAFQILRGACAVMNGMGTFAQAAIEDSYLDEIRQHDSFTVNPS